MDNRMIKLRWTGIAWLFITLSIYVNVRSWIIMVLDWNGQGCNILRNGDAQFKYILESQW